MSRRNNLLVENDVPVPDAHGQHVCSCCGHIMTPGQGDTLKIETDKAIRSRSKKQPRIHKKPTTSAMPSQQPSRPGGVSKTTTCGKCHRQTRLKIEGPRPISRPKKVMQQKKASHGDKQPVVSTEPAKVSANASSKKRAKNRKAGLQALLDQATSTSSSGLGLSLSNFMKK